MKPFTCSFVNHAVVPRSARRPIRSPGKRGIDHHAFQHAGGAVATVEREVLVAMADAVAEVRIAPLQVADDLLGVGIEQQLVRIEAQSLGWIIRTVHAIAIDAVRDALRADSNARPGRSVP